MSTNKLKIVWNSESGWPPTDVDTDVDVIEFDPGDGVIAGISTKGIDLLGAGSKNGKKLKLNYHKIVTSETTVTLEIPVTETSKSGVVTPSDRAMLTLKP